MSFAPPDFVDTSVREITVDSSVPQPPAGTTIVFTGTSSQEAIVAITDPDTAANPIKVLLNPEFVENAQNLFIAIATANVDLSFEATEASRQLATTGVQIRVGVDEQGNFLQIGGLVIRGRSANGLSISLEGGFATEVVPPEKLPPVFSRIFAAGLSAASLVSNALASAALQVDVPTLNTLTELSRGNDYLLGTEFNDGVVLSKGKDVIIGGGGDDVYVADSAISKARIKLTMDGSGGNAGADGFDDLIIASRAIRRSKRRSKIVIDDFDSARDTIILETSPRRVTGIGTDELTITTKKGGVIEIISGGSPFNQRGVEFV